MGGGQILQGPRAPKCPLAVPNAPGGGGGFPGGGPEGPGWGLGWVLGWGWAGDAPRPPRPNAVLTGMGVAPWWGVLLSRGVLGQGPWWGPGWGSSVGAWVEGPVWGLGRGPVWGPRWGSSVGAWVGVQCGGLGGGPVWGPGEGGHLLTKPWIHPCE